MSTLHERIEAAIRERMAVARAAAADTAPASPRGSVMADPITAELTALRKARGYTQHRVAALSGVPRSTIAAVESRRQSYSIDTAMRLAEAFGLGLALVERGGG
jgi:DNA-binding XRE family transcriptional regulator